MHTLQPPIPVLRLAGVSVLLGIVVLAMRSTVPAPSTHVLSRSSSQTADRLGAHIDVQRDGETLHVHGLFANEETPPGEASYHLDVRRTGDGGTMTSRQAGTFETRPQQTDTLSTVTVNASPGARVVATLEVRRDDRLVDETRAEWTVGD